MVDLEVPDSNPMHFTGLFALDMSAQGIRLEGGNSEQVRKLLSFEGRTWMRSLAGHEAAATAFAGRIALGHGRNTAFPWLALYQARQGNTQATRRIYRRAPSRRYSGSLVTSFSATKRTSACATDKSIFVVAHAQVGKIREQAVGGDEEFAVTRTRS